MNELGNICTCENPKRIINPYTNEVVYVKCRKCKSCLEQHSNSWVGRLYNECKLHQYSAFVNLTYDNNHLPYYEPSYLDEDNNLHWTSNRLCDEEEIIGNYDYIPITHSEIQGIPYVCKSDIVNFIKRLRSNIHYYFKKHGINTNEKIRYYCGAEYGPKTLRPHYHLLIWFDSEEIAKIFGKMLSKSWSLCTNSIDWSYVNSTAPQYVAKYINGNSCLPEVLCAKSTRVFHLQSKKPIIGYSDTDLQDYEREIIDRTYGHREYDITSQSSVYVQPPLSLESRYLPKCRQYRFISRAEKLRIYSFAYDLKHNGIDRSDFGYYHQQHFESAVDMHCSYACYYWCEKYSFTPDMYLDMLEDYFLLKDFYLLKCQYEYQERYCNDLMQPTYHLVDMYPTLLELLPNTYREFKHSYLYTYVQTFGIDIKKLYPWHCFHRTLNTLYADSLHQKHSQFYKNNVAKVHKKFDDSIKVKIKNELSNPLIFS